MGFKEFLFRGNLIQLAVAVVIGAAFGNLVSAFTTGLITPLLGIFGGQPQFKQLNFTINSSQFLYGLVIDAAITFLITALVLYYVIVFPSTWVMDRFKKTEEGTQRPCPECTSAISKKATRCPFCTTVVVPPPEEEKVEEKPAPGEPEPV